MYAVLLPLLLSVGAEVAPTLLSFARWSFARRCSLGSIGAQQGHNIEFISNLGTSVEIQQKIRTIAKQGKLQYVVLVGDAPKSHGDSAKRPLLTPTFRIPARILNVMAGIDELDTDNPYSDLNDDGVPELAIGRLPAHSAEELGVMLKRILAYEDSRDFGPWRARIDFVTGQGSQGYFDWIDSKIEAVSRQAVGWEMPPAFQASMTNAVWESPFCPDPPQIP